MSRAAKTARVFYACGLQPIEKSQTFRMRSL
jgi:hypothetical protein